VIHPVNIPAAMYAYDNMCIEYVGHGCLRYIVVIIIIIVVI